MKTQILGGNVLGTCLLGAFLMFSCAAETGCGADDDFAPSFLDAGEAGSAGTTTPDSGTGTNDADGLAGYGGSAGKAGSNGTGGYDSGSGGASGTGGGAGDSGIGGAAGLAGSAGSAVDASSAGTSGSAADAASDGQAGSSDDSGSAGAGGSDVDAASDGQAESSDDSGFGGAGGSDVDAASDGQAESSDDSGSAGAGGFDLDAASDGQAGSSDDSGSAGAGGFELDGGGDAGADAAAGAGGMSGSAGAAGVGGAAGTGGGPAGVNLLFFSEYVEGSWSNKALEVFNGGTQPIDLAQCAVKRYMNGSWMAEPQSTILAQNATLNPGGAWVVCSSGAAEDLLSKCDALDTHMSWNGNDALELVCGSTTHDVIGQIGVDPGSYWGTGNTRTVDRSLRRKCSIVRGDSNGADPFDPTAEWDAFPKDTFDDLGVNACPYQHTITIDGINDFLGAEAFQTTSSASGYTGFITWDATYLYIGMQGPDIVSGDGSKWVTVYIDGVAGTTEGVQLDGQKPVLPFSAQYHVRWKANNQSENTLVFNGSDWIDALWDFAEDIAQAGDYMELRIPRADIGLPNTLKVIVAMLDEVPGDGWTFAGIPSCAFSDSADPDYTRYFHFDLASAKAPGAYSPSP